MLSNVPSYVTANFLLFCARQLHYSESNGAFFPRKQLPAAGTGVDKSSLTEPKRFVELAGAAESADNSLWVSLYLESRH